MTLHDAIIIGAGLAGSSMAIQLAERGHSVLLLEQQHFPLHKLCGEFLSVEVTEIFGRLGILDAVRTAGAVPIQKASLSTSTGESFDGQLPGTALGLSRYALDKILWDRASEAGARCLDRTPVTAVRGSLDDGFVVSTADRQYRSKLVFGAYGKRSRLDGQLGRAFAAKPSPFVAGKAHYRGHHNVKAVELHAFPGGYCGLSAIESGLINVCWIGHAGLMQAAAGPARSSRGELSSLAVLRRNHFLVSRLQGMDRVGGSSRSLSRISFALKGHFDRDVWMIGDTAGMIAPLCGDGMAMALGSADLAAPIAKAFLSNSLDSSVLRRRYRSDWNRVFRRRLQLGRCLHQGFLHPSIARLAVGLCNRQPALGNALIRATRGSVQAWAL